MSTAIINMALDLLKEEPILSATDDRTAVRWMNRNYQPIRDSLMRLHPWNWAMVRVALAALSTPPAFGWAYQYQLPADCIRVLPLTGSASVYGSPSTGGTLNGPSVKFAIEGRYLLTNAPPPIQLSYIQSITDETLMDAAFVQALATTLAARAANFITGKGEYAKELKQEAGQLVMQAQMVDALEGTPPDPEQDDWVNGRSGGQYWNAAPGTVY